MSLALTPLHYSVQLQIRTPLCASCCFPFSPGPTDMTGSDRKKGERGTWPGGGHSSSTPRHSEEIHPKYFPLCAARVLLLLLCTQSWLEKVNLMLKVLSIQTG